MKTILRTQALTFFALLATSFVTSAGNATPSDASSLICSNVAATSWNMEGLSVPQPVKCLVSGVHIVLIGEVHGTNEIPRFVGDLVAQASRGRPVVIGLERNAEESSVTNNYIQNSKDVDARNRLLSTGDWAKGLTDGRSSGAIANLLDTARDLRSKGANIKVVLMVRPPTDPSQIGAAGGIQAYVDQSMADVARQALKEGPSDTLFLGYMGEMHAMPSQGVVSSHEGSVSDRLADMHPLVILATGTGHAWNCTASGCGEHKTMPLDAHVWDNKAIDVRTIVFSSLSASSPATPH